MIGNIPPTKSTPGITFDSARNTLEIYGESYPEDALKFYRGVIDQLNQHLQQNTDPFQVNFRLTYFNTSSARRLYEFMQGLEAYYQERKNIVLNWYYENEDEAIYESGVDFRMDIKIPVNLIVSPHEF